MTALARRIQPRGAAEARTLAPLYVLRAPQPDAHLQGDPTLLHVRVEAFAAAVAVHNRPALRDRALLVGGDAQGRGAVLAVSAAAQAEGVRPGMLLRAAEKLCPHAVVLPCDPEAIAAAARDLLAVLGAYTPVLEPAWMIPATARKPAALDMQQLARCFGATLDVRGCDRLFGSPITIADRIGRELEVRGYAARIGVAGNAHLAAVAATMAETVHPVFVPAGYEQEFMAAIPLARIEGLDPALLERLRGLAERALLAPPVPVVLDAACTLEDPTADGQWLDRELARLAARLAGQLAAHGKSTALLALSVEFAAGVRSHRLHLKQPVAGAPALLARARDLLAQVAPDLPVTGLRLRAEALGPAAAQLALPLVDAKLAGHEKLEAVAHRLRGRFGPRAARRAQLVVDAVLPEDRVVWDGPENLPARQAQTIEARVDAGGQPEAIRRDARSWETLRAIRGRWRIRANWWGAIADRHYYRVETERGAVLELYQDQADRAWRLAGRWD